MICPYSRNFKKRNIDMVTDCPLSVDRFVYCHEKIMHRTSCRSVISGRCENNMIQPGYCCNSAICSDDRDQLEIYVYRLKLEEMIKEGTDA